MDARTQPPNDVAGFDPVATAGDCVYDHYAAEKAVRFFELGVTHTKGKWAGKPFKLEPWQDAAIRTLFGWQRQDGTRRFRTSFWFLPRKNGKSAIAAAISNYMLLCDGEAEAECYCAASDREQASLVFKAAASMLRKNEQLAKRVKIRESTRRVIYKDSFLRAIPANEGGSHGFNSSLIVGDELHTWPNRDFYDTLHTSTGAREQPLEIYITTAGHDQTSICYEVYSRAKAIRDGKIEDETFLPVLYEAEEGDDFKDPAVWAKANPNLGVSVREDYIAAECKKAIENPAYENTFKRLHLNMWTAQDVRWLPMDKWRSCEASPDPIHDERPVWGGLDLASVKDFTAFVMVARDGDGYKCWGHYWLPQERIDYLERKHNIPLTKWVREGWVTAIPGAEIEDGPIIAHIAQAARDYDLRTVGFDRWGSKHVRQQLEENHGITMAQVGQGVASLNAPAKELEKCVLGGRLDHSCDPVLDWMADNAVVKPDDNGNIKPVKTSGGVYRHIDGIVALIMAIGEAQADGDGESLYSEPGALFG